MPSVKLSTGEFAATSRDNCGRYIYDVSLMPISTYITIINPGRDSHVVIFKTGILHIYEGSIILERDRYSISLIRGSCVEVIIGGRRIHFEDGRLYYYIDAFPVKISAEELLQNNLEFEIPPADASFDYLYNNEGFFIHCVNVLHVPANGGPKNKISKTKLYTINETVGFIEIVAGGISLFKCTYNNRRTTMQLYNAAEVEFNQTQTTAAAVKCWIEKIMQAPMIDISEEIAALTNVRLYII